MLATSLTGQFTEDNDLSDKISSESPQRKTSGLFSLATNGSGSGKSNSNQDIMKAPNEISKLQNASVAMAQTVRSQHISLSMIY